MVDRLGRRAICYARSEPLEEEGVLTKMNPIVIAALIGAVGVIIGAALKEVFPLIVRLFSRPAKGHNLIGTWDSAWGHLPSGPPIHHETLTFERQQGVDVSGTAVRDEQPQKKWEVQGRYDGVFLQMYYYPS